MNKFNIRFAEQDDVPAMADAISAAWQTAYTDVMGPEFPRTRTADKYEAIFTDILRTGKETLFVCEMKEKVIGLVSLRDYRDGIYDCEVGGLYVHPGFQGKGAGSALLDAAKDYCRGQGLKKMIIWTLLSVKNNKFYEKQGGVAAEYKTYTFGGSEYKGVGYAFDL